MWTKKFHQLVMNWISRNGKSGADQPFRKTADWKKLHIFLKKVIPNVPENLGLKDFRRFAIKRIFDSEKDIGKKNFYFINLTLDSTPINISCSSKAIRRIRM